MIVKIKLTVTGSNPPNRTRSLIEPKSIEIEIPEDHVEAATKRLEKFIAKLENFKDLLKF